jgi:acyl carrier protein
MKDKIEKIVFEVVSLYASENGIVQLKNPTLKTVLFGMDSFLDSIGLVTIIVEVESKIFEDLNINVSLSDEKAMSQTHSPFKTIESLTTYIVNSLTEK